MLIASRNYIFQFIEGATGNRSEAFICTPPDLQELIVKNFKSDIDSKIYVLVLADTTVGVKHQEFVSRYPLYTKESWSNLSFNEETSNA